MARWYMVLYTLRVNPNVLEYGRFPVLSTSANLAVETAKVNLPGIRNVSVRGIPNQNIQFIQFYNQ